MHSFARTRPLKPRMGQGGTRCVRRFAMVWLHRGGGARRPRPRRAASSGARVRLRRAMVWCARDGRPRPHLGRLREAMVWFARGHGRSRQGPLQQKSLTFLAGLGLAEAGRGQT